MDPRGGSMELLGEEQAELLYCQYCTLDYNLSDQ